MIEIATRRVCLGLAMVSLACLPSRQAFSQTIGFYTYKAGKTTGSMTVTDVSACSQKDALGCTSAVRPLKVQINTINDANGADCDLDAVEKTAGRIDGGGKLKALFVINDERSAGKANLSIAFDKAGAEVRGLEGSFPIGCGMHVGYDGRWRRKAK